MWTQSLGKDCAVDVVSNRTAAGTGTVTGSTVDMQDFDGIAVFALLDSAVNGSVVGLQVQTGSQSNGSDAALPTGGASASYTFTASPSVGALISEAYRPLLRYVTPVLTRTTQNVAVGAIMTIRYRGRVNPVTQPATVLAQALAAGA
jgi:hypothetical protein